MQRGTWSPQISIFIKIHSTDHFRLFFKDLARCVGLKLDFLDFAFLCATLKADPVCYMCRIAMVDSAFERAQPNVYDHVMNEW